MNLCRYKNLKCKSEEKMFTMCLSDTDLIHSVIAPVVSIFLYMTSLQPSFMTEKISIVI